jgi:hypothetical protein
LTPANLCIFALKYFRRIIIKKFILLILACMITVLVAACGGTSSDPAQTVEDYLQAKVEGDQEALRGLLCSEMESILEREARSFESVSGVEIEGMACTFEEAADTVRCEGTIVALYGTEETEFPLSAYRVVEEDGEWRWCGEAP